MSGTRGFVVTGASRGLGAALVDHLMHAGEQVVAVHRKPFDTESPSAPDGGQVERMTCDLADLIDVGRFAERLVDRVMTRFDSLVFISNAGAIGPIRQVGAFDDRHAIADHVNVNYLAPVLIIDEVVGALSPAATLDIVNITSGAAERPIPGWSLYCSSKRALKSYLEVLDVENNQVTVTHIDPGVMDTGMQATIRESDARDFPGVEQFRSFQSNGRLRPVGDAARTILEEYLG